MMFSSKRLRFGCALAAALLLAGCDTVENLGDTMGGWFSNPSKSKLRGERIPLNATDEALRPDPTLQGTPLLLPPPYRNPEWPQPGGFASNAMYHLDAPGRLRQIWEPGCRQGLGYQLPPDRFAGGRRRAHLHARFRGPCLCLRCQHRPGGLGQAAGAQERHRHAHAVGPAGQAQHHRSAQRHGRRRCL